MRFAKLLPILVASPLIAAPIHFRHHAQAIGIRNRVHVNRLITEPGTVEVEAAGDFSGRLNPLLLKFTPAGAGLLVGRTEYSIGFDFAHSDADIALAANTLIYDGARWNVSFGPALTSVRHSGDELRAGATLITRYDQGPVSLGVTAAWSKATQPSGANPADLLSLGFGVGTRLGRAGWRQRLTVSGNVLSDHASATRTVYSTFQGVEWEVTPHLSLNLITQQLDWRGSTRENITFAGLTVNFGRLRLH